MKFRTVNQVLEYADNYDTSKLNIDLSSNHIKDINGLENIQCISLKLSFNEIVEIPENWNPKCDVIHLDENHITKIGQGSFSNKYYHFVNFYNNNMKTLDPLWKPTIRELTFCHNEITNIPIDFDLTCYYLGLAFNKIKQLHNFTKLKCYKLDLFKNLITEIPNDFYINCKHIELSSNNISYIPSHFSTTVNKNSPIVLSTDNHTKYYLSDSLSTLEKLSNKVDTIVI
jgi:hypothetical protein